MAKFEVEIFEQEIQIRFLFKTRREALNTLELIFPLQKSIKGCEAALRIGKHSLFRQKPAKANMNSVDAHQEIRRLICSGISDAGNNEIIVNKSRESLYFVQCQ